MVLSLTEETVIFPFLNFLSLSSLSECVMRVENEFLEESVKGLLGLGTQKALGEESATV